MRRVRCLSLVACAHACTLLALVVFAGLSGLDWRAPLAMPGAGGMPLAWAFNLSAWIAPGLVLAFVALRLRNGLGHQAGVTAGIALRLLLIAALAFAAQGLLPLDADQLDAGASRWHVLVWMVWNLAFAAAAAVAGFALRPVRWPSIVVALAVPACLLGPALFGPGLAERAVLACWWAWTALLAWRLSRQPE